MRTRTVSLIGALLLILPALAGAQQETQAPTQAAAGPQAAQAVPPAAPAPPSDITLPGGFRLGRVDVGFRGDHIKGDEARYNRFRDLRQGAFLDNFKLEKETPSWFFLGEARNVGYRDQRFAGEFESIGRLKTSFSWDQIPLYISRDTRSLQTDLGNGILGIDDAIQQAVQNSGTQALSTFSNAVQSAKSFDMKSRRHVADFDFTYTANKDVDVVFNVRNTQRDGYHLQSFGLLSSPGGGISQELGIPMDTRTTDVKAAVEFANIRGLLSAGINASWFDNRIPTVQFDNPLRATDISAGPSKGLAVMWPSNSFVSFVANGGYKLPARTRAMAAISVGRANQNEPLAAPTINTALVAPPLERTSAEARADVVSMIYGLNSKPIENLWLNARYRFYDYSNKTPHFAAQQLVGDWSLGTALWETEPLSVTRHTLDLDASFTPFNYLAFGAGYGREDAKRTFRVFDQTEEDVFRVSVDSTGNEFATLRLKYEFSKRKGSGFEEHLLDEVGEQPDMRHFDIADRDRSRVTGVLTVTPVGWLAVYGSLGTGHDDYKNTGFGLRDNKNNTYGVGFDLTPRDTVSFGLSYDREKYTANQYSRTAVPAGTASGPNEFFDARRDWWTDSADRVETVTASLDLLKAIPKTDIRLAYDISDGEATYVYGTRPDAPRVTITGVESAVPIPQQLAPIKNRLTGGRADCQYFVRSNVAIGVAYWYDAYRVEDRALSPTTIDTLNIGTATLYSGYLYRPYTVHTGWLRVTYLW
jgi:MtrB/PioB family decaheme-associated outer membrane protein